MMEFNNFGTITGNPGIDFFHENLDGTSKIVINSTPNPLNLQYLQLSSFASEGNFELGEGTNIVIENELAISGNPNSPSTPLRLNATIVPSTNKPTLTLNPNGEQASGSSFANFSVANVDLVDNSTVFEAPVTGNNITIGQNAFGWLLPAGPGGVGNDLTLWLNAEEEAYSDGGTTLSNENDNVVEWHDQSRSGSDATIATAGTGGAIYKETGINFNPSVYLPSQSTGNHEHFNTSGSGINANSPYTILTVSIRDELTTGDHVLVSGGEASSGHALGSFTSTGTNTPVAYHRQSPSQSNTHQSSVTVGGGEVTLIGSRYGASGPDNGVIVNGNLTVDATTPSFDGSTFLNIGNFQSNNSNGFASKGGVAEVAVYDRELSDLELQKAQSYLALKYGLSLDSSAGNYVNSAGTSVYDLPTYSEGIAGIGYDQTANLDQRVAKSQEADAVLTLATNADFTSPNGAGRTPLSNGQYLVLGHSGGDTTSQTTELPELTSERIEREWRVENTGSVTAINLKFDGFGDSWSLVVDADGDFSSGANVLRNLDANGEVSGITLSDGQYLTLAEVITPEITYGDTTNQYNLSFSNGFVETAANDGNVEGNVAMTLSMIPSTIQSGTAYLVLPATPSPTYLAV